MGRPMKVFAACDENGNTKVRVLIRHDMETGRRKEKDGSLVPAHFIKHVRVQHKQKTVLSAQWGTAVSKNPSLFCYFRGGSAGDEVSVSWVDNLGENNSKSTIVTKASNG